MRLFFLLSLVFCHQILSAQQTPYGTYYRTNWQVANPAAIDRNLMSFTKQHPDLQITSIYRKQWLELKEEGPITAFLSFENAPRGERYRKFPIRWGGQLYYDKTDIISDIGAYFNYSYEIKFKNSHKADQKLRLGSSIGVISRQYNWSGIRARDDKATDPTLLGLQENNVHFDFAFGAFYHSTKEENTFYCGLSLPGAFGVNLHYTNHEDGFFLQNKLLHANFLIGKHFSPFLNKHGWNINFEPSLWVRYAYKGVYTTVIHHLPVSADGHARVYFKPEPFAPSGYWFGLGMGTNLMGTMEFGLNLPRINGHGTIENNFQCGIAFNRAFCQDITLGTSFELTLAYGWQYEKTSN